ncbi:hypothetical protein M6B38_325745 [Iris pallida]|uniref:GRF-type domain-containing protein n=1 Tax=Iris pallida TaxID=29817 RepID=A0AAX6H981_IRIPA|nr:hypothetical protein M6B38_325745 [Iris pallida]
MAQNEATEPEWDLAKIPCYCEVICLCKLLTSNTPSNRGRKFLKCANERENPGCQYISWMQQSKASKTKKKLVDDGATTSSGQDKDVMKEILLEVETEYRVAQRQVELYGSFLKKFGGFKI